MDSLKDGNGKKPAMQNHARQRIKNEDNMLRINFLYQIQALQTGSHGSPQLNFYYGQQINSVKEKAQLLVDPLLKRTMCQACKSLLIPGENSTLRWKKSKRHPRYQRIECGVCGAVRKLPWSFGKKLKLERIREEEEKMMTNAEDDIGKTISTENERKQKVKKVGDLAESGSEEVTDLNK